MFNEYDVVVANKQLNEKVPKGSIGTILIVYPGESNEYEVEFVLAGETLDVLTVKESDLLRWVN